MMQKSHILEELRRTAKENFGVPLGKRRFYAETGIREADWSGKHWAKWSDALREAGLQPNRLQGRLDDAVVLERLAELVRELGHYPTVAELKMKARRDAEFPSHNTLNRFGSKPRAAAALSSWCEQRGGFQDVIDICSPLRSSDAAEAVPESPEAELEFGYVYLLKSGRFYKVGRSNAVGRRERELAIQLPERAQVVHSIKTDDPVGIESYWHRRFQDRRKNGEWFELTAKDLAAFRRRKFM